MSFYFVLFYVFRLCLHFLFFKIYFIFLVARGTKPRRDHAHFVTGGHLVTSVLCADNEDDSIGSRAVNRYTCSINAFGLRGSLSQIVMFYRVKSHKKFILLDTFNELLCYCGFALRPSIVYCKQS